MDAVKDALTLAPGQTTEDVRPQYSNQSYTVGWLCALPRSELTAARKMLDKEHKKPDNMNEHDENSYIFGEIEGHNVVIACMPPQRPGNLSAQKLVQPLKASFPKMNLHLFVGIGGGIPRNPPKQDPNDDIHLGDVVVGWAEEAGDPAVVQYELVRQDVGKKFKLLNMIDKPNRRLLNALGPIISDREQGQTTFHKHLRRFKNLPNFQHPSLKDDLLYEASYKHVSGEPNLVERGHSHCYRCDDAHLVARPQRKTTDPQFHQGTILSGEKVMKDPHRRDELSKMCTDAICIEMEAAGVTDDTHCLVIRGIADYADSHKYWSWQNYAAASAAAFAREVLRNIQPVVGVNGDHGVQSTLAPIMLHVFVKLITEGELHYRKQRPNSQNTSDNLTAALTYFKYAETLLRASNSNDPSLHLKVSFRLMTIQYDLSHDRRRPLDHRIRCLRRAYEHGSSTLNMPSAARCCNATHVAQMRLEQAFLKGRMAELEGEKKFLKEEAREELRDAVDVMRKVNGDKFGEYVGRVEEWKWRLR